MVPIPISGRACRPITPSARLFARFPADGRSLSCRARTPGAPNRCGRSGSRRLQYEMMGESLEGQRDGPHHVYLPGSFVLEVNSSEAEVCFTIEAGLELDHPLNYSPPHPGEMHAYTVLRGAFGAMSTGMMDRIHPEPEIRPASRTTAQSTMVERRHDPAHRRRVRSGRDPSCIGDGQLSVAHTGTNPERLCPRLIRQCRPPSTCRTVVRTARTFPSV